MSRSPFPLTLALTLAVATPGVAHDFSYDNLLLAWMNLNDEFAYSDRQIDSYMQVYRSEIYNQFKNNEFRLRAERKKTEEMMRAKAGKFDTDEEFVLRTSLSLGEYDFDKGSFPVLEMRENDNRYWYPNAPYHGGGLPSTFKLFFVNATRLREIPLSEEAAEAFVGSRTDRYGRVNREVHAVIRFRIKEIRIVREIELSGEITSATVYDSSKKVRVIHRDEGAKPGPGK